MPKILEIFPIVHAQVINATSQPTWGTINIQSGGSQSAIINISASKSSVVVGEKFKLTIEVKTNNIQINEYRLFLNFDPNRLQVIDKNSNVAGTQITSLDQLFLISNPAQDNLVTSGEIRLIAKTQTGNAFQVNRIVAEVEFQAQASGSTTILISQGSGKTALLRANGTSLNFTTNSQIINVSTSQNQSTNNNNNQTGSGQAQLPPSTKIPDTAILEGGVGNFIITIISISLILIGISLSREPNSKKN